jgi:lysophospholipase L1-like esterase
MRGKLLTALTSVVLSLGLLEALLRISGFSYHLYPERVEFGAPDPVSMTTEYRPDRTVLWVTGDYGLKLATLSQTRPRLIFMGDSCTQFGDYPARLVQLLRQDGRLDGLDYASLGVGSWSSYQGLQQFRRDVAPLAPRLVTVYYGWNDHWYGFGIEDKEVARIQSRLFVTVNSLRLIQLGTKAAVAIAQRERPTRPLRVSLADFKANLREMAVLARRHGITMVLLSAPSSHRIGYEPAQLTLRWIENLTNLVPLHQSYVNAVREVAAEERVHLCDLATDFQQLPAQELQGSFMLDGIHFTAAGNQKTAEFLYQCFVRDDLVSLLAQRP